MNLKMFFLLYKDVETKDIVMQVEEVSDVRWMLMSHVKERWEKKDENFVIPLYIDTLFQNIKNLINTK